MKCTHPNQDLVQHPQVCPSSCHESVDAATSATLCHQSTSPDPPAGLRERCGAGCSDNIPRASAALTESTRGHICYPKASHSRRSSLAYHTIYTYTSSSADKCPTSSNLVLRPLALYLQPSITDDTECPGPTLASQSASRARHRSPGGLYASSRARSAGL